MLAAMDVSLSRSGLFATGPGRVQTLPGRNGASAGVWQADLDRAVSLAGLEGGLRRGRGPARH